MAAAGAGPAPPELPRFLQRAPRGGNGTMTSEVTADDSRAHCRRSAGPRIAGILLVSAAARRLRTAPDMRRSSLLLLLTLACTSPETSEPSRIDGAPAAGPVAPSSRVGAVASPLALTNVDGVPVIGASAGVFRGSLAGDDLATPVPLLAAPGEATQMGRTTLLARRGDDGWFAFADHGLFHSTPYGSALSPFSAVLAGRVARTLDVTGRDADEALWITTDSEAFVRRAAGVTTLALSGGRVEAAFGIDTHRAILVGAGAVWEADVDSGALIRLATSPGAVRAFDRADDGTLYLGTDGGLLVRGPSAPLALRSFADEGTPARAVRSVGVGLAGLVAVAGDDVVLVDDAGARSVGKAPAGEVHATLDVNGDVWLAGADQLQRLATGKPVSFERDVKPFFASRCQSCHASGAGGAPVRAFDNLDVAKGAAAEIVKRLRGDGRPVMPPGGGLRPSDYRSVLRWVQSGTPS